MCIRDSYSVINDSVKPDIDLFLIGECLCRRLGTNIEANNYGVGSGREHNIRFGYRSDTAVDYPDSYFFI